MGRACGEPDGIDLTPMGVELNGIRRVPRGLVALQFAPVYLQG